MGGSNYGDIEAKNQLAINNTGNNTALLLSQGQNVNKVLSTAVGSTMREDYSLQLQGIITISSANTISLQHYISYTSFGGSTYDAGAPASSGAGEVYCRISIEKLN
jgi:hypothetical protein